MGPKECFFKVLVRICFMSCSVFGSIEGGSRVGSWDGFADDKLAIGRGKG